MGGVGISLKVRQLSVWGQSGIDYGPIGFAGAVPATRTGSRLWLLMQVQNSEWIEKHTLIGTMRVRKRSDAEK
jgi:hypothetical protein